MASASSVQRRRTRRVWRVPALAVTVAVLTTLTGCGDAATPVETAEAGATSGAESATTKVLDVSSDSDAGTAPTARGAATVTALLISRSPDRAEQVDVVVRGDLPDACRRIAWELRRVGPTFVIDVWSISMLEPDELCTASLEPFEEVVPLGLVPTGTYLVRSGTQEERFEV